MGKINNVWVFSDSADRYADLLAGARQLGEHVNAVIWDERDVTEVKQADAVYLLCGKTDKQRVENYAETFASLIKRRRQNADSAGRDAPWQRPGGKLSVLLQSALVNDVTLLERNADDLYAEHRMYGGLAFGREKVNTPVAVITLASGVYEPLAEENAGTPPLTQVDYIPPANEILCRERRSKTASNVDLGKARRVIGIGRGLLAKEDLQMVWDLASALDAEVGCSRPIAEGEHWMDRERYVGVSGVLLKSDIYLALGISGQIQHMVGGNGAKTIIAVNKDKNAPIFQYADYGWWAISIRSSPN
jgi:electron transfer flavoprotein alpha subunit